MIDLAASIFEEEEFREQLRKLRVHGLYLEYPILDSGEVEASPDWNSLLMYGGALALAKTELAQVASLRIASICLASEESSAVQKAAATALLERAGNHRAVQLAQTRGYVDSSMSSALPVAVALENVRSSLELSVPLHDGDRLHVNRFQLDLWRHASATDWLSVSAPTSAGKSRVIREWILNRLRAEDAFTAVYVAPTRALVDEVSADFRREVPAGVGVFTMPWDPEIDALRRRVLVVTQERLHLIQQARTSFNVELLFVDEAQGLGGAHRGILLRQTIDRVVRDNPQAQVIFASPLTENPELLLDEAPTNARLGSSVSEVVTVVQNLIWVEGFKGKPDRRDVYLIEDGERVAVGRFELANRATKVHMRLAFVAHAMAGESGGNVIYANDADGAEKIAHNLVSLLPAVALDDEIRDLQDLIRTAVHPQYALVQALGHGVAFHYGNMPLIIRSEIERLFSTGQIRYLVCTSTLLEGVNLPCKSIFMRNPQKGRGNPLSESDFWNLAGRAGRWGKEFQGNIVCVDTDGPDLWPVRPTKRQRSRLRLATTDALVDTAPLASYVAEGFPVSASGTAMEHFFSYLVAREVNSSDAGRLIGQISNLRDRAVIYSALQRALSQTDIPVSYFPKHSGIAPGALARLRQSLVDSGLDRSDLTLPRPEEADAKARIQAILVRIGGTMTDAFGRPAPAGLDDRRKWQLANLLVNWMQGMPLARLIDQRAGKVPLAKAIRDVMSDIETVARFLAPKYLSAYNDVLGTLPAGSDDQEKPLDITMMLELGVSRHSEVVLMSLGLSRTATIALSEFVTTDSWTVDECLAWLSRTNIEGLNVPVLVQREVREILETGLNGRSY